LFFLLTTISFSQSWDRDHLGNHRAVVRVTSNADAVKVHIPWRRRDSAPENKSLVVVDVFRLRWKWKRAFPR
jgi:predicted SnoaL-like aldol condensation-catalyzing enzyme